LVQWCVTAAPKKFDQIERAAHARPLRPARRAHLAAPRAARAVRCARSVHARTRRLLRAGCRRADRGAIVRPRRCCSAGGGRLPSSGRGGACHGAARVPRSRAPRRSRSR
jgi:hypothetical protein